MFQLKNLTDESSPEQIERMDCTFIPEVSRIQVPEYSDKIHIDPLNSYIYVQSDLGTGY